MNSPQEGLMFTEVQEEVVTWFKGQAADFYDSGIQKLVPRLNKYLENAGDYVEKQSYVQAIYSQCSFCKLKMFICGNKMPTRCNRGFYCRSYCLINMFRAPLCPSSGAQDYYTVFAACGISCCGFQVAGLVWS